MTDRKADAGSAPLSEELCGAFAMGEVARAKVNLTLEILGRRPDGYHELRSLVAFAAFGDELRFTPAKPFSLRIDGPFASALEGGNLVRAAAEAFARAGLSEAEAVREAQQGGAFAAREKLPTRHPQGAHHSREGKFMPEEPSGDFAGSAGMPLERADAPVGSHSHDPRKPASLSRQSAPDEEAIGPGRVRGETADGGQMSEAVARARIAAANAHPSGAFHLIKHIPVAAGLGGGSADAAAALRLLARHFERRDLSALMPLAAGLGADVPACLFSKPAIMTGIGECLRILPAFPALPIVLVNPRLPLSTAAVFRELQAAALTPIAAAEDAPELLSIDAVIDYASSRRNDLEAPARRLMPAIGTALDCLAQCPGALLTRLSGSGPTCFALFRTQDEAASAAKRLRTDRPDWWITASLLG